MSNPYIGEIRLFAGTYAPAGWAACDGSLLSISTYEPLYNLLGTTYGGDGVNNFGLPDLRGRFPVHVGSGYPQGEQFGAEQVTLSNSQMPSHSHAVAAGGGASTPSPTGGVWAQGAEPLYSSVTPAASLNPQAVGLSGGGQPHENLQPYVGLMFIIALFGIYPSPN